MSKLGSPLWLAAWFACAPTPLESLRAATYPPTFEYLSRNQIRSEMRELTGALAALNGHLQNNPDKERVLECLAKIDAAVGHLDKAGETTGHVQIDEKLPLLRSFVLAARESIDRPEPDYLLASSLVGTCIYCHGGAQ